MVECYSQRERASIQCNTLFERNLERGPIKVVSRVDGEDIEHRMAVVYEDKPNEVYVYQVVKRNITFWGSINYSGVFDNVVSSMAITKNLLFVTF